MSTFAHQVFADFSDSVTDFVKRADRTTLKASLFDALRRTEVTLPAYSTLVPGFLQQIAVQSSAKDLGLAMRKLAGRPNPMHLAGAPWQCLLERERCLTLGLKAPSPEDLLWTLDYVGKVLTTVRSDRTIFPCSRTGWHMRILDDAVVKDVYSRTETLNDSLVSRLRRLSASLELYAFMLHGEHRDGTFDHGPYAVGAGRVVVVKDYTDLRSEYLPWSGPEARLSHPAISIALVLPESYAPQFNWAGTMTSATEMYEHLEAAAVFAVTADAMPKLEPIAWDALEREARSAQRKLFVAAAGWPADQRIKYGSWLFTNHLHEIPRILGLDGGFSERMISDFAKRVDQEYEQLNFRDPSPIWAALRRPQPFTPL